MSTTRSWCCAASVGPTTSGCSRSGLTVPPRASPTSKGCSRRPPRGAVPRARSQRGARRHRPGAAGRLRRREADDDCGASVSSRAARRAAWRVSRHRSGLDGRQARGPLAAALLRVTGSSQPPESCTKKSSTRGTRPGNAGCAGNAEPHSNRALPSAVVTRTWRAAGSTTQTTGTPTDRYQLVFSARAPSGSSSAATSTANTGGTRRSPPVREPRSERRQTAASAARSFRTSAFLLRWCQGRTPDGLGPRPRR